MLSEQGILLPIITKKMMKDLVLQSTGMSMLPI